MKQQAIIIILILHSIPSYSQFDKEKRDNNFNDEKFLFLSSELEEISEPTEFVNTVWYIWTNRDGGIGAEVSPDIAKSIILYPKLIFTKFRDNPNSFNDWIDRLPYDLFTDYNEGRDEEKLVKLKKDLLKSLSNYKMNSEMNEYQLIIETLIEKINTAKIYIVR